MNRLFTNITSMDLTPENNFLCPYCGTSNSMSVDISAGRTQKMISDCERCCRPFVIEIQIYEEDSIEINVRGENE